MRRALANEHEYMSIVELFRSYWLARFVLRLRFACQNCPFCAWQTAENMLFSYSFFAFWISCRVWVITRWTFSFGMREKKKTIKRSVWLGFCSCDRRDRRHRMTRMLCAFKRFWCISQFIWYAKLVKCWSISSTDKYMLPKPNAQVVSIVIIFDYEPQTFRFCFNVEFMIDVRLSLSSFQRTI